MSLLVSLHGFPETDHTLHTCPYHSINEHSHNVRCKDIRQQDNQDDKDKDCDDAKADASDSVVDADDDDDDDNLP